MKQQRAFTLVELSIVLVILGLLVGGVLTGQSLIRAAELRSVSTQQARFVTAVQTFRDKYFALPGDMANAQSYWGIANGTPATCATTASTDAKTCNGDGNGRVDVSAGSNESFRFWQHLANAGLIEGSYDGIQHGSSNDSATVENSPAGRISASLWYANYFGSFSGNASYFDGNYDNVLVFGGVRANHFPYTPLLKPEETYNIDMKLDDGRPATGKVVGMILSNCTDTTTLAANYQLTNTAQNCILIFKQAF